MTAFANTGTIRDEHALHDRFASLHQRGEWFRFDGELRDFVEGAPFAAMEEVVAEMIAARAPLDYGVVSLRVRWNEILGTDDSGLDELLRAALEVMDADHCIEAMEKIAEMHSAAADMLGFQQEAFLGLMRSRWLASSAIPVVSDPEDLYDPEFYCDADEELGL